MTQTVEQAHNIPCPHCDFDLINQIMWNLKEHHLSPLDPRHEITCGNCKNVVVASIKIKVRKQGQESEGSRGSLSITGDATSD